MAGVSEEGGDGKKIIFSTYVIMALLKSMGALKPGFYYRFVYNTKYNQLVTNTVLTGSNESLLLLATSTGTFDNKALSIEYPDDAIIYNFDDNLCEDGVTARNGFIYSRKDTETGNSAPFDFRKILFRRYAVDVASISNYQAAHAYTAGDLMKGSANTENSPKVYRCLYNHISAALLVTDIANKYWMELFDYSDSIYLAPEHTFGLWNFSTVDIPVLPLVFQDFTVFNTGISLCYNCQLEEAGNITGVPRFNHNVIFQGFANYKNIFISSQSNAVTFAKSNCTNVEIKGSLSNAIINLVIGLSIPTEATVSNTHIRETYYTEFKGITDYCSLIYCTGLTCNYNTNTEFYVLQIDCITEYCVNCYISTVNAGRFKFLDTTSFGTNTTPSQGVEVFYAQNKRFDGLYGTFLFSSRESTAATYTQSYINVIANKTSPSGAVWYEITDDTGVVTTNYIQ